MPRHIVPLTGDAFGGQIRNRHTGVRVARASHVTHYRGQVERQAALVLRAFEAVSPQADLLGVVLDQLHLLVFTAGELEVVDGLLVDVEHRRGGAVFRGHVGDGRAVAEGQRRSTFTEEFQPRANHFLLAQELGQRQHHVGGGDARLQLAGQLDADAFRQTHPRCAAEHYAFGFQTTDTDGDHAQRIDVRGVAVGADAGIREGHAVTHLDHRRHFLQVDLVHDAVARRDHVDVLERLLGPVDEVETVFVATVFDGAVLLERFRIEATALDGQGVVDDQLGRHHRVHLRRITALQGDGVTQAGEVDQRGLAENVVAHHAGREPREVEVALALDELLQGFGERGRVAATHKVFRQYTGGVRQGVVGARLDRLDRCADIEVIQVAAGQRFTKLCVHRQDSVTVVTKGGAWHQT
ncbi:hypothetical protein D9M70_104640 [compost metagenome]